MKPFLFCFLGLLLLVDAAAPPPAGMSGYYGLRARWSSRPVKEIQADAERGQVDAQFYLGRLLIDGVGVPKDPARGVSWLRKAEAQGHLEALADLAGCLAQGLGCPKDPAAALQAARNAAARGSAAGKNVLAVMYSTGAGVPRSDAEALRLWREAAEAGNAHAQWNLGYAYSSGNHGLAPDDAEAGRWFQRSAQGGFSKGMTSYGWALLFGRGVATNRISAFDWLQRAAALDDVYAWRLLAENGGTAAGDDPVAVLRALRQAARLGDADAQFHLARLIAAGEVEAESAEQTVNGLLQAAAEADQIDAALVLGDRYRWGYRVPRDLVAAARWFLLGHSRARFTSSTTSFDPVHRGALAHWFDAQGNLRPPPEPEDQSFGIALGCYSRAAWQRDAGAMREIARLYQRGHLVPLDLVEAAAWHLLAQNNGSALDAEGEALIKRLSAEQQQRARDRVKHLLKRAS